MRRPRRDRPRDEGRRGARHKVSAGANVAGTLGDQQARQRAEPPGPFNTFLPRRSFHAQLPRATFKLKSHKMYQPRAGWPILRFLRWRAMSAGQLVALDQVHYVQACRICPKSARNCLTMDLYQPAARSDEGLGTGQAAMLELADVKGFARRKRESARRGKLRGLGIGNFLEVTAPPGKELADIAFNGDGTVTLTTGTLDFGMGHATPFAQVLSETLGVPFEKIMLVQGDSDRIEIGGGSGGSKSLMHSGTAIIEAASKVVEKGKEAAGYVLEVAASDIEFAHGRFVIAGTDRSITVMELARALREKSVKLPADVPQSLDVHHISNGPGAATFPNGCHVAEVEVDPESGAVELVKYSCVNDFGTVVNAL